MRSNKSPPKSPKKTLDTAQSHWQAHSSIVQAQNLILLGSLGYHLCNEEFGNFGNSGKASQIPHVHFLVAPKTKTSGCRSPRRMASSRFPLARAALRATKHWLRKTSRREGLSTFHFPASTAAPRGKWALARQNLCVTMVCLRPSVKVMALFVCPHSSVGPFLECKLNISSTMSQNR